MKSTTKLMITAAALAIATSVASAQTLKADIPFAFRAGNKVMAPGTYYVKANEAQHYTVVSNYDSKSAVILMAGALSTPTKAWTAKGDPVITFDCVSGSCELTRLWTATGRPVMAFPSHNRGGEYRASVQEIRLVRVNGD